MKRHIIAIGFFFLMAMLFGHEAAGQSTIEIDLSTGDFLITPTQYQRIYNGKTENHGVSGACIYHIYNGNQSKSPITTTSGGSVNIVNPEDGGTTSKAQDIFNAWAEKAKNWNTTEHHVTVQGSNNTTIILDNVYCTYVGQTGGGKVEGGLAFQPTGDGQVLTVKLKGDNRMNNLFYSDYNYSNTKLIITSSEGDTKYSGTLTVGDINTATHNHSEGEGIVNNRANWYNSVIGGSDNDNIQNSRGIEIKGGTIYAGALEEDNCTAIGAGGNGIGGVTISGGQVTAVTSSTGSAIGGGIGWTLNGGAGNVTITGGKVYAYNYGFAFNWKGTNRFVPAAAIGGGSSFEQSSDLSKIIITGGEIYAQAIGGTCIGGGGSGMGNGAHAQVNIEGNPKLTLCNMAGDIPIFNGGGANYPNVPYGTSIGGGTGGIGKTDANGDGGNADVTIKGGTILAGSIGGGATNSQNNGHIGLAHINITGGDIQGQFIMEGITVPLGTTKTAEQICSFTMSAGKLHGSDVNSTKYGHKKKDGGALWIDDKDATTKITGGEIYGNNAENGGAIYMTGGTFTMTSGVIGKDGTDENNGNRSNRNIATKRGGGVYLGGTATFTLTGGSISYNTATGDGGGAFVNGGKVSVANSLVTNNISQEGAGGGIYANSEVTLSSKSKLNDNSSCKDGGGIYTASTVIITGASEICRNSAGLSGGGVYVATEDSGTTVTLGEAGSSCIINGNSAMGKHSDKCGGGGIYLSKGTVKLTNSTVDQNKAPSGLGGGIYIGNGTIDVNSGSSSSNYAHDGGGLYAGGGKINFNNGGTISNNTVTHNGGGVYASAADIQFYGDSSKEQYAVISGNNARNGGGIFLSQGAEMFVKAAFVNGNKALVDSTDTHPIPKSAFWEYTNQDDDNNKQYLQGVGGGVYLDTGVDKNTDLTHLCFQVAKGESLGIFSNRAATAADDIFANGDRTFVEIPDVDEMKFEGFGGAPTGWYEDYMTNDEAYTSGTFENNRNGATGIRYRTAYTTGLNNFRVAAEKANVPGRYICLALGDPFSNLIIKVSGLKKGESAVFTCTKEGEKKPTYYIAITGTSDSGTEVSRLIKNVPIGKWHIEQTDWNWAYSLSSDKEQIRDIGVETAETPVASYVNSSDSGAQKHGESIVQNVFDVVVSAANATVVIPRDKNNNKNIEL